VKSCWGEGPGCVQNEVQETLYNVIFQHPVELCRSDLGFLHHLCATSFVAPLLDTISLHVSA
jgi:hypothetical protein